MNDNAIAAISAVGGSILTTLVGGWDMALEILLIVVTMDYITGVAKAFKNKIVNSSDGYIGIVKKASIFVIIILAAQMDRMLESNNQIFRNCTAFFFVTNEALSVLENVGELGIKLPTFLRKALVKLRDTNSVLTTLDDDIKLNKDTGKDEKENR